ncbi:1,6-anhydro-N-acetylmuramyl-L-alanine amidase AmpD [Basilea psittacipulmonis]|nr:1,6-anhydro-N-acetylmuramyl-L-alanine amidase AmpD [Basilea psittacipulmonis]
MNITNGWLARNNKTLRNYSPNFNERNEPPYLLIIHFISLPPRQYGHHFIRDFFTNKLDIQADPFFEQIKDLKVSSHVVIYRTGVIEQFVNFNDRAWHAGVSCFEGRETCNDFSIGIELEGCEFEPFTKEQYRSLIQLTRQLKKHYPLRAVCGHEDVAPGRKNDPGPFFDWTYYRQQAWCETLKK